MYRLEYNSATNTYGNLSGIEIRVPHFGGDNAFHTYQKLVDYLQDVHGYTNKNVRLAPYDWRLAPRMCNVYRVSHCMYTDCGYTCTPRLKAGEEYPVRLVRPASWPDRGSTFLLMNN